MLCNMLIQVGKLQLIARGCFFSTHNTLVKCNIVQDNPIIKYYHNRLGVHNIQQTKQQY